MKPANEPARAKLFENGRSQAVRLPKEFRFEGTEVLIRREGHRVILEPAEKKLPTREEIRAWFAEMDAIGGEPLRIEDRNQGILEPKEIFED